MNTSDLIARLQSRLKEYGDLPVCIIVKGPDGQLFAMPEQTAHAHVPQVAAGKAGEVNVILSRFIMGAQTVVL